jgi:G:T/U-mismatch repair DNA glycosylase
MSKEESAVLSSGFRPAASRESDVLILGTLPGPKSLELQQYYARKGNAFWPIMDRLFGAGPAVAYGERLALPDLPERMQDMRREVLPSTSAAYAAMRFEEKLRRWEMVLTGSSR